MNARGADVSSRASLVVDLALVVLGLVVILVVPHHIGADGEPRFAAIGELVTTGHVSSVKYSLVLSLLATPLWLVGRALGDARAATAMTNPLLFVVGAALLARNLSDLPSRVRRTILVLLVFGSMYPNHLTVFYGEVLTSLTVALGVAWLSSGRTALGWTSIVIGAVNTPATLLGVGLVAVRTAWRTRRWQHLLAPVVAFALCRVESLVVRGGALTTGYENESGAKTAMPYSGLPGFSYPLFFGLLAIFLSFGKGLLFFTPGLFAPAARETPPRLASIRTTLLWYVAGLVLVYAKWWSWYGGSFWGPRFFLAASVPSAISLATHAATPAKRSIAANALLAGAILLSFWVGVNGLVFDQTGLGLCSENGYALESFCHFMPEMSVLWHPFVDFASAVPQKTRPLAIALCVAWMAAGVWTARDLLEDLARGIHASCMELREALTRQG